MGITVYTKVLLSKWKWAQLSKMSENRFKSILNNFHEKGKSIPGITFFFPTFAEMKIPTAKGKIKIIVKVQTHNGEKDKEESGWGKSKVHLKWPKKQGKDRVHWSHKSLPRKPSCCSEVNWRRHEWSVISTEEAWAKCDFHGVLQASLKKHMWVFSLSTREWCKWYNKF